MSGSDDDTNALLQRCARADRSAFRQLYDLLSPTLYGVALRLTRDPSIAADVVHDTFVQVWRGASAFDASRGSALNWLRTLVRNRAIDLRRRTSRERADGDPAVFGSVDDGPNALDALLVREENHALKLCMEALSPDQRRALSLVFFDGLTHAELSSHLKVAIGTVHSWIRRAITALRRCLEASATP